MSPDRSAEVAVVRALPATVVLVDRAGTILDVSERAARVLGAAPEDLIGRDFASALDGVPADEVRDALAAVAADGAPVERTLRFVDVSDGGVVEVRLDVAPTAGGAAVALERRRPSTDDLLAAILAAVSSPTVGTVAVERALQEIGASHSWDLASLWVVDDRADALRSVAVWAREAAGADEYRRVTRRSILERGAGMPGAAWVAGETLQGAEPGDDPRIGPSGVDLAPCRVHHPLAAGGRIVGVIELLAWHDQDPAPWVDGALRTVEPALGHLLERLRDRLAVNAAEGRLAAALDAGQFGVAAVDVASGHIEWSSRMADLHGQTPVEGAGPLSALLAAVHPDDQEEIRAALRAQPDEDEPIRQVEYRVVIEAEQRWLSTRITPFELPGGQTQVAAITSDVTERRRSEEQSQRRAMAVEGLQWVSQAIIAGRELRETAIAVAHAATGVLGASVGAIVYQVPGDTADELAWALSGLPADAEVPAPPSELALPPGIGADGAPSVVDLRTDPDVREFVRGLELPVDVGAMRSALLVPIRGEEPAQLGLMLFLHPQAGYFNVDDVRLARSIGTSTGVAVENAKRHEQQRLAATAFQAELLPSGATVPNAELCVRYHPGRDGMDVGGDWYDVIALDDGRVGLAVGDVCGHGLTAAAHMGQLRHSFRALVQSSVSPEEALRVLNRLALDELRTTMTMVYVELDTVTGECLTWRCGHLPPIIADRTGEQVRWLGDDEDRGPMLGFLPEYRVRPTPERLAPGELLLLYTDGLLERRGESIDVGLARLAEAFVGRSPHIEGTCDELYHLLAQRGPTADDTAILALRRR